MSHNFKKYIILSKSENELQFENYSEKSFDTQLEAEKVIQFLTYDGYDLSDLVVVEISAVYELNDEKNELKYNWTR